jgi:hypothetical protein
MVINGLKIYIFLAFRTRAFVVILHPPKNELIFSELF